MEHAGLNQRFPYKFTAAENRYYNAAAPPPHTLLLILEGATPGIFCVLDTTLFFLFTAKHIHSMKIPEEHIDATDRTH